MSNNKKEAIQRLIKSPNIEEIKVMFESFFEMLENLYPETFNPDQTAKDLQKLMLIESYMKYLFEECSSESYFDALSTVGSKLFDFMIDFFEYNHLPQVVSKKEYENLKNKRLVEYSDDTISIEEFSGEYYRGSQKLIYLANTMCDYDYHHGIGVNSNGLYASIKYGEAKGYSYQFNTSIEDEPVARFKLATDKFANEIDIFHLAVQIFSNRTPISLPNKEKEIKAVVLNQFFNSLPEEDQINFKNLFEKDFSLLAIYLGYDCISNNLGKIVCILNREKIVFEEQEFYRICNQTKVYKNGLVDYEQKEKTDFRWEK